MRTRERIPLHDHTDDDSGGIVGKTNAGAIAVAAGVDPSSSGGSSGSGGTTSSDLTLTVVTASGTACDIDWSYDVVDITITDDVTYTYTNLPITGTPKPLLLIRRMGAGGPWTETFPAATQWDDGSGLPGGDPQTLNTTEDARTVCTLFTEDGGTTVGASYDRTGGSGSGAASHILIADGHSTPFAFDDLLQMDDGSDFMWSDPE